jgi:ribose transport system substrate-binding protein
MRTPFPILLALTATAAFFAPQGASAETIAVFTKNTVNPFSKAIRLGSDIAGKALNVDVSHYVPTTGDYAPEQIKLVDDALAKKPDAIVFDPVDTKASPADTKAMAAAVERVNGAGIPAVDITDKSPGGKFVSAVLPDDYQLGLATGRVLLKAMGGKGNVVILEGIPNLITSIERVRGFNDAIKEFPQVKLLASKSGGYQRRPAQDAMEGWIRQFPQIDGVLAANDSMGAAAVDTLEKRGRKGLVVGINGSKEAIDLIKAGKMLATGEFNGFIIGCLATEIAVRNLRKQPVPAEVILKPAVYDKDNYAKYEARAEMRQCPSYDDEISADATR